MNDTEFLEAAISELPDAIRFDRTDVGNAELLAYLSSNDLKFDPARGWMAWTGKIWKQDRRKAIQLVTKAARWRYRQAITLDMDEQRRESSWAISSQQATRVMACLQMAEALDDFEAPAWDANPWLLGVKNGTVNLKTGKLQRHQRTDYITLTSKATYDPLAACPRWDQFITEVFPDIAVQQFIQRAAGYSLTGLTTEQSFFLCFGKGANGKSKFLWALKEISGDAAHVASFSTFEKQMGTTQVPNDIAALQNKRFVMASEAKDTSKLDEARIKSLSGDDEMSARFLHREWFSFRPVLKLWLAVNHRPLIDDDSLGVWRRMKLIPFEQTFDTSKETDLEDQFRRELSGILTWAVRGALFWAEDGLRAPEAVVEAVEDYREDSDVFVTFIREACDEHPSATTGASILYDGYRRWSKATGYSDKEILTLTKFGYKMAEKYKRNRTLKGIFYVGIRLT